MLAAVNTFIGKHPGTKYPRNYPRLVTLVAHIDDLAAAAAKKGKSFLDLCFLFVRSLCPFVRSLAGFSALNKHFENDCASLGPSQSKSSTLLFLVSVFTGPISIIS